MPAHFLINQEELSHELIDGEVVIIQFDTGNYYSLSGTGAAIWQQLTSPAATADLLALFTEAPASAEAEVAAFLDQLVRENLLTTVEATDVAAAGTTASALSVYATPELNKYTDMQQLLLADPLHEVEDSGWPHTKPAGN